MFFVDTNLKIFVKKFASILLHTTKRKKTSKKNPEPLFLMARFLDGMHLLNRVSSNRMREEADYPASFCVWDQDQEANPPFGDRRRGVPSQDRSGEGRKKNQWANWTPWEKLCCITVQTRRFAPLSLDYVRVIALPLMASKCSCSQTSRFWESNQAYDWVFCALTAHICHLSLKRSQANCMYFTIG